MSQITLGLGDYGVITAPEDVLKTFALGSCVAVVLIDLKKKIAGMAHVVLPDSAIDPNRAREKPAYFADTGITALLQEMKKRGSEGRLVVKLAGGAQVMDSNEWFNIGKKNILAIKKTLWANRLGALAEDIGGTISRTVSVNIHGEVTLSSPRKPDWTL